MRVLFAHRRDVIRESVRVLRHFLVGLFSEKSITVALMMA